jgi:hypothetical protein
MQSVLTPKIDGIGRRCGHLKPPRRRPDECVQGAAMKRQPLFFRVRSQDLQLRVRLESYFPNKFGFELGSGLGACLNGLA